MGLRDAKFSLLLVCRDLVRLLVLISLVYLIDKDSALLLTTTDGDYIASAGGKSVLG